MGEPTVLRCSSMDDLFACTPAVLNRSEVRINPHHDAADLGKAVHEMAAEYVNSGSFNVNSTLHHYGVDESAREEVLALMEYAQRAWDELGEYFQQPRTEAVVKSDELMGGQYQLAGTTDVVSPLGTQSAIFTDW